MSYIKLNVPVEQAAAAAYEAGHYIEAIQLLHGFIENQARSYLMLIGNVHFGAVQAETWDVADKLPLHHVLTCLYVLNQLTANEYTEFGELNALRNRIVHQYFKEPYEGDYRGIPRDLFDGVFQKSIKNASYFTRKCEEIVG